jgi:hypothetical protein
MLFDRVLGENEWSFRENLGKERKKIKCRVLAKENPAGTRISQNHLLRGTLECSEKPVQFAICNFDTFEITHFLVLTLQIAQVSPSIPRFL